jgi:hypothetical protein
MPKQGTTIYATTPWEPRPEVLTGVFITLLAAAWLRINVLGAVRERFGVSGR